MKMMVALKCKICNIWIADTSLCFRLPNQDGIPYIICKQESNDLEGYEFELSELQGTNEDVFPHSQKCREICDCGAFLGNQYLTCSNRQILEAFGACFLLLDSSKVTLIDEKTSKCFEFLELKEFQLEENNQQKYGKEVLGMKYLKDSLDALRMKEKALQKTIDSMLQYASRKGLIVEKDNNSEPISKSLKRSCKNII